MIQLKTSEELDQMAAAEGLYETRDSCAPFSVLTIGSLDGREEKRALTVPCLLSFLGTNPDGTTMREHEGEGGDRAAAEDGDGKA